MQNQRKLVTVISLNLDGCPVEWLRRESEKTEDVSGTVAGQVESIIAAHGGRTEPGTKNAWRAIFGAEQAQEDDPARAVRAALALLSSLIDVHHQRPSPSLPVPAKIVVHTAVM